MRRHKITHCSILKSFAKSVGECFNQNYPVARSKFSYEKLSEPEEVKTLMSDEVINCKQVEYL